MITQRTLPEEKGTTRQVDVFRCELWNEGDATVRVYICDSNWLHVYLLPPMGVIRDVWVGRGPNSLSAFNVETQACLKSGCFNLQGPVCFRIEPVAGEQDLSND
jgi:hypothetical protein